MSSASILVSRSTLAVAAASLAADAWKALRPRRRNFTGEPLKGPIAAALDRCRHVGQRDDRADLRTLADELERRHVALDRRRGTRPAWRCARAGSCRSRRPALRTLLPAPPPRPIPRPRSQPPHSTVRPSPAPFAGVWLCARLDGTVRRCGSRRVGNFPRWGARVRQKWLRRPDACSNLAEAAPRAHAARPSTRATLRTAWSPQHRHLPRRSTGVSR